MAAQEDQDKIYKLISIHDEPNPNHTGEYFADATDQQQRDEFLDQSIKVPNHWLPSVIFQYNLFGHKIVTKEHLKMLRNRMLPGKIVEPSYANYRKMMHEFNEEAK